ncbi:hypothetical protein ALPR1_20848 [Algoriphagus machipongonensis]|uniref:Uncharacterized protein n=1 Tax=Algoriphagus machipongonensis TaxID=388413 RepID=A3HY51_9BACT|nr:hypothetical protein ALPR1_20848 [Algoriphagus machipongonensis]
MESKWQEEVFDLDLEQLDEKMLEVPMTIPYRSFQEDFQVTNTRFEKDGKFFRAIKERYINDTLQIIYVPDTGRNVLNNAFQQWVSGMMDDELPQDQGNKSMLKNFAKDYMRATVFHFAGTNLTTPNNTVAFTFSIYQNPFYSIESPPPQNS